MNINRKSVSSWFKMSGVMLLIPIATASAQTQPNDGPTFPNSCSLQDQLPFPKNPGKLILFISDKDFSFQSIWKDYLQNPEIIQKSSPYFTVETVVLNKELSNPLSPGEKLALKYGLAALPATVLTDHKNRVLFIDYGGAVHPSSAEKKLESFFKKSGESSLLEKANRVLAQNLDAKDESKQLCDILEPLPSLAWKEDYPKLWKKLNSNHSDDPRFLNVKSDVRNFENQMELKSLIETLRKVDNVRELNDFIEKAQKKLGSSAENDVPTKQSLLVNVIFPAYVKLETLHYDEGHNAKSEEAFLDAISSLEQARDMDANSDLGKWAHEQREKLRQARLSAARYD